MSNLIIQAVEIKLGAEYTEDTSIGLYTVSGVSYLRWSEATLAGVAETWTTGILLKNGIGDIVASSDLSRGGNIANYDGLTVTAANAGSLMQSLKDLQINLTGLSVTVTEFEGTLADSDATSRTVMFTGVVEDIKWGDTALGLSLKNSLYKRQTTISTQNENGVTTPVCFGKLTPPLIEVVDGVSTATDTIRNLAKFVRTLDSYDEETYKDTYFTGASNEIKIFPVVFVPTYASDLYYTVQASADVIFTDFVPEDTYAIIVDGDGEGQIRQVTRFQPSSGTGVTFLFYVKDVLLTELSSTGDTRSWVQFVKIGRKYNSDNWTCKDFLKSIDGTETGTPELHSYYDDKFNRIADFGFTVKDSAENNALDIDGSQYSNNIDNLDSFLILPVTSLALEDSDDLSKWDNAKFEYDAGALFPMEKVVDGIYSATPDEVTVSSATLQNASSAYDKDYSSYSEFSPELTVSAPGFHYAGMLKFGLPKIPDGVDIEKIYLGVRLLVSMPLLAENWATNSGIVSPEDSGHSCLHFILRRFAYTLGSDVLCDDKNITEQLRTPADVTVNNLPDFYYEANRPSTANLNFIKDSESKTIGGHPGLYDSLNGLTMFEITDNANIYRAFVEGGIFHYALGASGTPGVDVMKIYDLAIIVKLSSSSSIKKEIFSPLAGRIYGDTWGSRKTAVDLMENPKDIIEHCKRLQDWSEIPGYTTTQWGSEYSVDALIRTSGNGSFDSENLNYLTSQSATICTEITDLAKQTTTAITKKLCDTFGMCSYIDNEGYECIETLELTNPTGDENTITLTDVIGGIGDIQEPKIENVFCEPIVNYLYNQGSGKYDKALKITNITAAAWQSSYTPGYLDSDGEIVWNSCKPLYNQFRWIEPCPSEFSDQSMIADYTTAVNYVKRKIAYMTKMRLPTITIDYSKGKDYYIYKHILVQLPMHTNNVLAECIIEKIVKSKNTGTVKIDCVILSNIENAWYDTNYSEREYQDTATPSDPAVIDQ